MKKISNIIGISILFVMLFFNVSIVVDEFESHSDVLTEQISITPANANVPGDDCTSGGEGSSSCTYHGEVLGVVQECSVTCVSGYYACCRLGWNLEAQCTCKSY